MDLNNIDDQSEHQYFDFYSIDSVLCSFLFADCFCNRLFGPLFPYQCNFKIRIVYDFYLVFEASFN